MRVRRVRAAAAAIVLVVAALSGCATTLSGTGQRAPSGTATDAPTGPATNPPTDSPTRSAPGGSPSGSAPVGPTGTFACPRIKYPHAHLSFDCIVDGLSFTSRNLVWPVSLHKTVEASTGWVLEEGAGNWGDPAGDSPRTVAKTVRQQMVDDGAYGQKPRLTTEQDVDTRIGGVAAHVLQTTVTLDPQWAKQRGTKVRVEKLWIVVLKVSDQDYALWYVSLPILASRLWAKVPATMKSIRVG